MYSFTTQRFNRTGTKRSNKVTKSSSTLSRGKKVNRRVQGLASSTLTTGQPDIVPGRPRPRLTCPELADPRTSYLYRLHPTRQHGRGLEADGRGHLAPLDRTVAVHRKIRFPFRRSGLGRQIA